MVWSITHKLNLAIQPIVEQIIASGKMSRQQHLQLASAILADQQLTDEERRLINRVFDYVQTGRLKLTD
jgi:hypothetical protein